MDCTAQSPIQSRNTYPSHIHSDGLRPRPGNARSARSTTPPNAPQAEQDAPRPRSPTPADIHPWGGKFVQLGHKLSQVSARVQVFFEGLVGLSSPHLAADKQNETVANLAQRLFEIRLLSGDVARNAQGPMTQDFEAASQYLQQQRSARDVGDRINSGVHGAFSWCKSWF